MKKKKLIIILTILGVVTLFHHSIHTINKSREQFIHKLDKEVVESKKSLKKAKKEVLEDFDESLEIPSIDKRINYEQIGLVEEEPVVEEKQEIIETPVSDSYTTRMTSYWSDDGYGTGECTGSGKCSWDFDINDKGWYMWEGKLVVATATTYLANQGWQVNPGVHLYKYYEELVLTIDGIEYDAIVIDSCGNAMRTDRVDLFVSNGGSAKDTTINVRRK